MQLGRGKHLGKQREKLVCGTLTPSLEALRQEKVPAHPSKSHCWMSVLSGSPWPSCLDLNVNNQTCCRNLCLPGRCAQYGRVYGEKKSLGPLGNS